MHRLLLSLVFVASIATPALAQVPTYTLTVTVTDVADADGDVRLGLYDNPDDFLHIADAFRVVEVPASRGTVTLTVPDVPAGTYAIALYHDEDGDGALDTNFMHLPTEGTGLSNNLRPRFGPPRFRNAAFEVSGDTALRIALRY